MQVGWTSPSLFNSECSFELFDSAGTSLYDSGSAPTATVPMMGLELILMTMMLVFSNILICSSDGF